MSDPELRSEQRAQCEQNAGLLLIDDVNPQIFGAKQVKARARGDTRCVARQACWLDRYLRGNYKFFAARFDCTGT